MPKTPRTREPDLTLIPNGEGERWHWRSFIVSAAALAVSLLAVAVLLVLLYVVDGQYRADVQALAPAGTMLAAAVVVIALIWTFREIRRVRRALEALTSEQSGLKRSQEYLRSLTWNASEVMLILDDTGAVHHESPGTEWMWGHPPRSLIGQSFLDLVHPEDQDRARSLTVQALASPRLSLATELRVRQGDGSWLHCEVTLTNLLTDVGVGGILVACRDMIRDVAERKVFEKELMHQAFHDPLSGLPNRTLFMNCLEQALARADQRGSSLAILFIDLDNFKVINDSLGHEVGDQLLITVAERLRSCVRPEDTAARFGGDEFTVLLENVRDPREVGPVALRIGEQLEMPLAINGTEVFATASIGIAISTPGEDKANGLLRKADMAMYRAKANGKARYEVFNPSMYAQARKRFALETDLRRAIERSEFRVYYQPIIQLDNGSIYGFEALIRWEHPRRGLIPPLDFIPIAEETGMILPIGRWVLRESCRQLREWQKQRPDLPQMIMTVNLSPKQFQSPVLVDEIEQVLREFELSPEMLKLEITEGVLMQDVAYTMGKLRRLKSARIQLAIDDFGTGHSSLAYLRRFPISVLKIDRSFVQGIARNEEDAAVVQSIIALGKALNLVITAEGIEAFDQVEKLRELKCDLGQGFFFSKPLPGHAVEALLLGTDEIRWDAGLFVAPPQQIAEGR